MTLAEKFKQDASYKTYRGVLKLVKSSLDLGRVKKEAEFLHSSRKSRKLHEMKLSPKLLYEALLADCSHRSRFVELKTTVMNQRELLESAISLCKKNLVVVYSEELKSAASTQAARTQILDRVFASGKDYLASITVLDKQFDLYINDLDKASYALTNVREILKILLDNRHESL